MNKWVSLFWEGKNYFIVPYVWQRDTKSPCNRCVFGKDNNVCPKYEGANRILYCVQHERVTGKEAYLIPDTPESVAEYIADSLSS